MPPRALAPLTRLSNPRLLLHSAFLSDLLPQRQLRAQLSEPIGQESRPKTPLDEPLDKERSQAKLKT